MTSMEGDSTSSTGPFAINSGLIGLSVRRKNSALTSARGARPMVCAMRRPPSRFHITGTLYPHTLSKRISLSVRLSNCRIADEIS